MKFKVGDKVRVRQEKALEREFGVDSCGRIKCNPAFVRAMRRFCGQIVTITGVYDDHYYIKEDSREWGWTDQMLEGYAFEYGEEIEVSNDEKGWFTRIYVGYIDGAIFPYCVVAEKYVDDFEKGEEFSTLEFRYARSLQKPRVEVEIKVNGKKVDKPLSLETAKRLGLVE